VLVGGVPLPVAISLPVHAVERCDQRPTGEVLGEPAGLHHRHVLEQAAQGHLRWREGLVELVGRQVLALLAQDRPVVVEEPPQRARFVAAERRMWTSGHVVPYGVVEWASKSSSVPLRAAIVDGLSSVAPLARGDCLVGHIALFRPFRSIY